MQISHTTNLADDHPSTVTLSTEVQHLQAQLAVQKQQYAGLQHQLEQLELPLSPTGKHTAYAHSVHQVSPVRLPANASNTQQHKLAVLVPYRDRQEHLAVLVSRLQRYLTVS